jgi:hypothetical protein
MTHFHGFMKQIERRKSYGSSFGGSVCDLKYFVSK